MKKIVIFGSTGSIGSSLINIIKSDKKKFKVVLLTANKNYQKLIRQAIFFKVRNIIITDNQSFLISKKILKNRNIKVYNNFNSLNKILKNKSIDYTMSAISGFQGLEPTIKIIKFTKIIAIANKESIICGWNLIKKDLIKYNTQFIPVDSEHFSIWSLINNSKYDNIEKIFITASGGPFIRYPLNKFKLITPKKAINHPNWQMGKKISIDSATMMNKIFEVIEAKKIFKLDYKKIKILVHEQSYIHAIVKFNNGLTKILIHDTKMTIPIFNSIYKNNEKKLKTKKIDFSILNNLNLNVVDKKRYPSVDIIDLLPKNDSLFETVIVSANDTLVEMFLIKKIFFTDISKILLKILKSQEFNKYRLMKPKNIHEIKKINDYVSLKIRTLCV